jgi:signal peptidase I
MIRMVLVVGDSMAPTYRSTDLLLTKSAGRVAVALSRGAVAVFSRDGRRMVKRAVGLPGDVVEMEAGRLFVNGKSIDGQTRIRGAHTQTWLVPEASYFMVGDNPATSDDSRVWGQPFVAANSVEATVTRPLAGLGWPGRLIPRRQSVGARQAG